MRHKCLLIAFALLLTARGSEPAQELPDQGWGQIYAELKEKPLRAVVRTTDDLEVRIWKLQALSRDFETVFLRRDAGKWSAFTWVRDSRTSTLTRNDVTPAASWESIWAALCGQGLLTLPDFETLPRDGDRPTDGQSIEVQALIGGKYREYGYPNSKYHDHAEARAIEAIYALVEREFYGRKTADVTPRQFLSDSELRQLVEAVSKLNYPLSKAEFLHQLPFDLEQRGLSRHGEWRLTSGVSPNGFFVLREKKDGQTVRSAEVAFCRNTEDEDERIIKPTDDPAAWRAETLTPHPLSRAKTK